MATIGQLRQALQESNARWRPLPLPDNVDIPTHPLGVPSDAQLMPAEKAPPVDMASVLATYTTPNPFLNVQRHARDLPVLSLELLNSRPASAHSESFDPGPTNGRPGPGAMLATPPVAPLAGLANNVVDWRHRWGWNWVTGVKDQDPCESCVAFGTTAVIESMVRIHHAVWCLRSEGDPHDGLGLHCDQGSWPDTYFDWIKTNGICDPDCYPYQTDNPP